MTRDDGPKRASDFLTPRLPAATTAAGRDVPGEPLKTSATDGLNAGNAASPSYQIGSTPSGACSCITRSAAVLVDAARVLPEMSRMRVAMRQT